MKSIKIFLVFFFIAYQSGAKDSLDNVIQTLSVDQTVSSIEKANDLSFDMRFENPAKVIALLRSKNKLAKQKGEVLLEARSFNVLGLLYRNIGLTDSAASCFFQAHHLYMSIPNVSLAKAVLYNLMNLNTIQLENPQKAIVYGKELLEYLRNSEDTGFLVQTLNGISQAYWKIDSNEKSLRLIAEGIKIARESHNSLELGYLYQLSALIYLEKNRDLNQALSDIKYSYQYSDSTCDQLAMLESLEGLILSEMGKYTEAVELLSRAEGRWHCFNSYTILNEIFFRRYLTERKAKHFEEAMNYLNRYDSIRFEVLDENQQNTIEHLSILYETEKQDNKITLLTNENALASSQRNFFIVLTFLFLAIATSAIVIYSNKIRSNKIIAEQRISQLQKEQEVMGLQSILFAQEEERQRIALDLHDSIGALLSAAKLHLSNIEAEVEKLANLNFLKSTEDIIERASTEVRRVAHDMMPGVLMKLGLFEGIEDFFERVRKSSSITISFTYDELEKRLETKREVMIYRIVQELVNNTLKHANANEIKLMIKVQSENLVLDYRDDGVGYDPKLLEDSHNFGLTGIKSRVNFINGQLTLNPSTPNGVHYSISFPI